MLQHKQAPPLRTNMKRSSSFYRWKLNRTTDAIALPMVGCLIVHHTSLAQQSIALLWWKEVRDRQLLCSRYEQVLVNESTR